MYQQKAKYSHIQHFTIGLLTFLLHLQPAFSSDSLKLVNNLWLGIEAHYGTILPHHKSIEYLLNSNIKRFQIIASTNTYGRTIWDEGFRYPHLGLGYLCTTLGNDEAFGYAQALFASVDIPFSSEEKKFSVDYQVHFGLAYLSRTFDINSNPLNMAISSRLNAYGSFNIQARYRIYARNLISLGANLSHFSNGKLATPNLGLNSITFSAGYYYMLVQPRYTRRESTGIKAFKKHQAEIILSGGTKTDDQVTGNYYLISSLVVDYKYVPWLKYAFGVGTDFFYDGSLGPNKAGEEGGSYSTADLYQFGLHGSIYSRYSKINIVFQVGTYVYANYYKYSRVYSRVGFRYEIAKGVLFNLTLKSHYAIADYLEWGIGYRF